MLTAIHSVFRGVQLDLLQEEVRELRLQLRKASFRLSAMLWLLKASLDYYVTKRSTKMFYV